MKKFILHLALLAAVMVFVAACGGETPTATSVPAAATPTTAVAEATATTAVAEPTATEAMAAPTATEAMAVPTATEAMAAPTATEAMAAPTATEAMAAETPTSGATVDTTPMAGDTPTPGTSTGPNADDFRAALSKMNELTSFHESVTISSDGPMGASDTKLEADIVKPSSAHMTLSSTYSDTTTTQEIIVIDQDTWIKSEIPGVDATWIKSPTSFPIDTTNQLADQGGFTNITEAGDETIDGTATKHYTFDVDQPPTDDSPVATTGKGEAWIAKDTGYLIRLTSDTTVESGGTSQSAKTQVDFSKFNDPSITVEPPTDVAG